MISKRQRESESRTALWLSIALGYHRAKGCVVLGRELQLSKEKTKQLEAELAKSIAPEAEKQLVTRALNAEALADTLKRELEDSKSKRAYLESRAAALRAQVDQLQCVKQEKVELEDAIIYGQNQEMVELDEKLRRESLAKQDLAVKLAALEREILQLKSERVKDVIEKQSLTDALRQAQVTEQVWSIEQYVAFAEEQHRHISRPDYISLQPICSTSMDLQTYIAADRDFRWLTSQKFICLPEPTRILWASTSCQVGLIFGPMYQYTAPGAPLTRHSDISSIYGKHIEVFFESGEHIYYAGTYLCLGLREENPQGCLRTDMNSAGSLADVTVPQSAGFTQSTRDSLRAMATSLYMEGILKAECVVLRCTAFNHRIHDTFSKRYTILSTLPAAPGSSTKRLTVVPQKATRSGPAPRKRSRGD